MKKVLYKIILAVTLTIILFLETKNLVNTPIAIPQQPLSFLVNRWWTLYILYAFWILINKERIKEEVKKADTLEIQIDKHVIIGLSIALTSACLLYTSPSPRDRG